MDKYLSIITNFGCHGRCPYCIVRENGIKVPKSTIGGLDKLEDAIKMTGANIVSISGGGDPLYRYSDNPLVPMYLGMVMGICIKAGIPMEMHTSYTESEFPYHFCKRVVYHLQSVEDLENVVRRGAEIVRVVFVATEKLSREEINRISDFVRCSDQIDELSFRQMVNDRYETEYYNDDFLKAGHNKGLWHYIRQKDYNIYYAENRIYTKFSEIEADIQEERRKGMLILPIKKKWFDMIASGEKKEEYREIKPYYDSRFMNAFGFILVVGQMIYGDAAPEEIRKPWPVPIVFRNGYSKESPEIICKCTLHFGKGKPEWGAEPGKLYYVLKIQEIEKGVGQ